MKRIIGLLLVGMPVLVFPVERTILVGPKTIGAGWKDNIVIHADQFQQVGVGDLITVYNDRAKGNAQGAFQDPKDWSGIAQEYGYFSFNGPFRMTVTEEILPKLRERGVAIGGHDYRILRVTHTPAVDIQERIVYKGPARQMKDDWSVYADIQASTFKGLQVGDGVRFHVSRVQPGAAMKVCDFTYNGLEKSLNGAPLGGDSFTYYVTDVATVVRFSQLRNGEGISIRVGGKGYRLDKIGIVSQTGGVDEDESTAQRCPPEYVLGPGELFRGEKEFPTDWSGNLRLTAEPFQDCTEADCLVISVAGLVEGSKPVLSLRENKGKWLDLKGTPEPDWMPVDGTDMIYTLDDPSVLDKIKTKGLVVTGQGFTLTKIELISIQ